MVAGRERVLGDTSQNQSPWTDNYKLRKNSQIVVFGDGRGSDCLQAGGQFPTSQYDAQYGAFDMKPDTIGLRHEKGANVGFADEHVSQEKLDDKPYTADGRTFLGWYEEPDPKQTLIWDFHHYQ